MRDRQVATFLETHPGFVTGWISSGKQNKQVTLLEVLESNVSDRYCLSQKACAGILRRAERRGKALPTMLLRALEQVVAGSSGAERQEDKTR